MTFFKETKPRRACKKSHCFKSFVYYCLLKEKTVERGQIKLCATKSRLGTRPCVFMETEFNFMITGCYKDYGTSKEAGIKVVK